MTDTAFIDIGLLRHGEAEGGARYRGVTDDPLTTTGQQQMWVAVGKDGHWGNIVSSPLARCAAFAHALARQRLLALRFDERLREMDFGAWDGRTADEIMQSDAEALSHFWEDPWTHGPPGGERLSNMQDRVLNAWRDILAERRSTLIITHGGPIRLILCQLGNHPTERMFGIDVPLASLRRIRVAVPKMTDVGAHAQ